jgi:predicted neutral ceramidase superfamily lipid hydrolase
MPTQSQKNTQEIIKLQGEVRLVNQKIDTLINNHLTHLETRINNINKILWLVLILGITSLADIIKTALLS